MAVDRRGTLYGVAAYGIWGLFPIYFHALAPTSAIEILAHRIVWSFVLVGTVLWCTRQNGWLQVLRRDSHQRWLVVAAAICIGLNWLVYVWAVENDRVLEAALGYFINPLITVALGVVVLGERLRALQWVAAVLGAAAVGVLTVAYGHFPFLSVTLAVSFAGYGYIKKTVSLQPMESLAAETMVLLPVAFGTFVWLGTRSTLEFGHHLGLSLALVSSGAVTTVPLVAFAAAARRIPLSLLGLLQYLTPATQFVTAVAVFDEQMDAARWFGFGIIWCALSILSFDAFIRSSRMPGADVVEATATT